MERIRASRLLWPALLAAAWLFTAQTAWASAGVILAVKGPVERLAGGQKAEPAAPGMELQPADVVLSKGGEATVMLADGRLRPVGAGQRLEVPAGGPAQEQGAVGRMAASLKEVYATDSGPRVRGMVKDWNAPGGQVRPLAPCNSAIFPSEFVFKWLGQAPSPQAKISLADETGLILAAFAVDPAKGQARYPLDAPLLTPGARYVWQVGSSAKAWFIILAGAEEDRLKAQLIELEGLRELGPEQRLALQVNLLLGQRLLHQAAGLLEASLAQNPQQPAAEDLLVKIKAQMAQ